MTHTLKSGALEMNICKRRPACTLHLPKAKVLPVRGGETFLGHIPADRETERAIIW